MLQAAVLGRRMASAIRTHSGEAQMNSTMMDSPLTITALLRRGARVFPESEVITCEGDTSRHARFAEVAGRIQRLASALQSLGIKKDDRVGTLSWNHQEHLEAYFA